MAMVPIREGLFTEPLAPPEQVKLIGSKCHHCGEVSFGKRIDCPNCASGDLKIIDLSRKGKLWSYTVIRNKPPGDYKGPEPFAPFGLGLAELPEGIRVVAPIDCDINKLQVGMELELSVYKLYQNEQGNDVMAFKFKPV